MVTKRPRRPIMSVMRMRRSEYRAEVLREVEGAVHARGEHLAHLVLRQAHEPAQEQRADAVPDPAPQHGEDEEAEEDVADRLPVDTVLAEEGRALGAQHEHHRPEDA